MPQHEHGPQVEVADIPGMGVFVSSSYRPGNDYWRGMVTLTLSGAALMDIEGSVKEGRDGLWFAPPSRSYEDPSGRTKYKNLVWLSHKGLGAAMVAAVVAFVKQAPVRLDVPVDDSPQPPLDDDDLPM